MRPGGAATLLALGACSPSTPDPSAAVIEAPAPLSAEGDFGATLQAALIAAKPGETILLPEGTFQLTDGLSLDVHGVTLRGAGQDRTILDFASQEGAGEGLLVTSDDVLLMDFAVRNTKGDGIKSKGADQIIYRYLTVEWTGGPDEANGAYGVYPVRSKRAGGECHRAGGIGRRYLCRPVGEHHRPQFRCRIQCGWHRDREFYER